MRFYLGANHPGWLLRTAHPLFVSRRWLVARKRPWGRALGPYAIDSGGFSELSLHGAWRTPPTQYAAEVARLAADLGPPDFAAIQDWMCEPRMLAKTGKGVREHQELTVASWLELTRLAPTLPWAPVIQGWHLDDYHAHAAMYAAVGVDLATAPAVGVGSICRRQGTAEARDILLSLRPLGLRLHAFGLKLTALKSCFDLGLASCDSMAWSYRARRRGVPLEGCTHKSCANCLRFALRWRDDVIRFGRRPKQLSFAI